MDGAWHDLRAAFRSLRRYPVAALVSVASLAGGIGATTITLTVRNVLFRQPPPLYQQPEQLSRVQVGRSDRSPRLLGSLVPAPLYSRWSDMLGPAIAGATGARERDVRMGDRLELVPVRAVTPELFAVLGVAPIVGHSLPPAEAGRGGPPPAVLSHRVWTELFDARPDVVGRVLLIDNQSYTVAGVMPARFWFSDMNAPIWTALDVRTLTPDDVLETVIRRAAGVTPSMLEAQLGAGLAAYAQSLPAGERQLSLRTLGLAGTPLGHQMSIALPYVLGAAVLLTVLIACANVAILMISQWTAREREIAIRAAIGAGRGRIVRSLLAESVLIAAVGGILGVCTTLALRGWIVRRGGYLGFYDLSIDRWVLAQAGLVALLTGVVAGVGPALYETRRLHGNPLRLMSGSDRVRQRLRHSLVVFEIAVTIALLVVTATMVDSYQRARRAQMGFATAPLLTARVDNTAGVPSVRILEVLRSLPGVEVAAASTTVPFSGGGPRERVALDALGTGAVLAERGAVSPEFFAALGIPVRAGRAFSPTDSRGARTAILTESLGRRLFPDRSPVGGQVWLGEAPYDVVGLVADYSSNPLGERNSEPRMFLPLEESKAVERMHFLVRASGDPAALVQVVRRDLRDAMPGNVARAGTMNQTIEVMGQEILIGTAPLLPLIAIGTFLTMAGIYGVLAFAITRRARELAVRVAVGATSRHVIVLVSAQTLRLVTLGAGLGLGLTFILSRVLRATGGAGSVFDPGPSAFVIPLVIVAAVGLIASWLPARRASRIDPVALLRSN